MALGHFAALIYGSTFMPLLSYLCKYITIYEGTSSLGISIDQISNQQQPIVVVGFSRAFACCFCVTFLVFTGFW